MGFFSDLFKGKERKRVRLAENKIKGKWAERVGDANHTLHGDIVVTAPHGQDRMVKERTGWNTWGPAKHVEYKSSRSACLSPLQKKTQKKAKGNYKVEYPLNFWS